MQTNLPRSFNRHDLATLLPVIVQGVRSGAFTGQNQLARAFDVDRATAHRWRRLAVERDLITDTEWTLGLLRGRMSNLMAAPHLAAA